MAAGLDEWMRTGNVHFQETGRHRSGRPLVKSYLIEANAPEAGHGADGVRAFFQRVDLRIPVLVAETDDPTLHVLLVGKQRDQFFLDTIDPRFWMLHSIAHAAATDKAVNKLVHRTRLLDAFWLPSKQLQEWSSLLGSLRSLTAKFSLPHGLYDDAIDDDAFLDDSLLLRLGTRGDASIRWNALAASEPMAPYLALWSSKVHQLESDDDEETFSDVTASGKIISRGSSFRLHEELAVTMRNRYSNVIATLESEFRLHWEKDDLGLHQSGGVVTLPFPEQMSPDALQRLIVSLFNGSVPYRMFGIPERKLNDRYVIKAIDLHTGGKIDFEITQSFIRAYLHAHTCGNVVMRLVTNLQHSVDARIGLPTDDLINATVNAAVRSV